MNTAIIERGPLSWGRRQALRSVRTLVPLFAALLLAAAFAACGNDDDDAGGNGDVTGHVTVFAAASLTDAFTELGEAFEDEYPGTSVEFNFGGSSALAVQINEGAPADVFASANETQMAVVSDAGNADDSSTFATNRLTVVTPAGSTLVQSFADLAEPGVLLVLAAPEVPVGDFGRQALELANELPDYGADFSERVLDNLVSNETDVRAVLTKVQLGEADAGIVYVTDVAAAEGEVDTVDIPDEANVLAIYPIATLTEASNEAGAAAFVDFVLSSEGQAVLADYGFGPPND